VSLDTIAERKLSISHIIAKFKAACHSVNVSSGRQLLYTLSS
jgi:hypothetical protein